MVLEGFFGQLSVFAWQSLFFEKRVSSGSQGVFRFPIDSRNMRTHFATSPGLCAGRSRMNAVSFGEDCLNL